MTLALESGALLADKPSGPTSHDVVAFARRLLGTPRVGHTGTLDPLATGLLVLLFGRATRLAQFLAADDKEYLADIRLGIETPTYDAASLDAAVAAADVRRPTDADLASALAGFRGSFLQTPPPYSAKKVAGTRAYVSARRSEPVDLKPVPVTVHELELLAPPSGPDPLVRVRVSASAGFYVRSLAHDLGRVLGCGAHLAALRRTRIGRFPVTSALPLSADEVGSNRGQTGVRRGSDGGQTGVRRGSDRGQTGVRPGSDPFRLAFRSMNELLDHLPAVTLTDEGLRRAQNGNSLAPHHLAGHGVGSGHRMRILDPDGEVLSIAERRADGLLHPLLVLR